MLEVLEYDREKATEYAFKWAYSRNPQYYDFQNIGGDCTNFASQSIFAGAGYMNYTPTYGWYYINVNKRAPAWTGVQYLYNFLTTNKGVGPFGREVPLDQVEPGDIIQLAIDRNEFHHTPFIIGIDGTPTPDNIYLAAHSANANCRPLSSYYYRNIRAVHIEGVRREV